jgi:hypothetical protein
MPAIQRTGLTQSMLVMKILRLVSGSEGGSRPLSSHSLRANVRNASLHPFAKRRAEGARSASPRTSAWTKPALIRFVEPAEAARVHPRQ